METKNTVNKLLAQIDVHKKWIQSNRHDVDGTKERYDWIKECQDLLDTLRSNDE